jgi:hypothetical protein
MFYKQINGVNIIHYNPTPLEQIQSRLEGLKTREQIQKKLNAKPVNKKRLKEAYKEFLEITEKYAMRESDLI